MEFVALLSSGKGSWKQIAGLIKGGEWEKVILLGNEYAKKFNPQTDKQIEFITIDTNQPIKSMREEIANKLKNKIDGVEVALSIASGTGKEHMALISALLQLPVGIRFFALTKEGIIEL